jgi:hypothetical protein
MIRNFRRLIVATSLDVLNPPFFIMEHCASYLIGVRLSLSAKHAIMRTSPVCGGNTVGTNVLVTCTLKGTKPPSFDDDDVSSSFEEDNSVLTTVFSDCRSVEESPLTVSFATPLITDIHFRPRTLRQDKETLYYSDKDYRTFRRDFHRGEHSVRFRPQVVTQVWQYKVEHDDSLYYSEQEIQEYVLGVSFVSILLLTNGDTCCLKVFGRIR